MEWVIVILLAVCVYGGLFIYSKKRQNSLIQEGKMVERNNEFFKQKHTFKTIISSTEKIFNVLDKSAISENKISCVLQSNKIVFQNNAVGGSFVAHFKNDEVDSDHFYYSFQVDNWTEKNSMLSNKDLFGANIVLTALEKAILKLDAQATITRENKQYKSKTKFI